MVECWSLRRASVVNLFILTIRTRPALLNEIYGHLYTKSLLKDGYAHACCRALLFTSPLWLLVLAARLKPRFVKNICTTSAGMLGGCFPSCDQLYDSGAVIEIEEADRKRSLPCSKGNLCCPLPIKQSLSKWKIKEGSTGIAGWALTNFRPRIVSNRPWKNHFKGKLGLRAASSLQTAAENSARNLESLQAQQQEKVPIHGWSEFSSSTNSGVGVALSRSDTFCLPLIASNRTLYTPIWRIAGESQSTAVQ